MAGQVVDLFERSHRHGHTNGAEHEPIPAKMLRAPRLAHLHEWDVDGTAGMRIERGAIPNAAHVRWSIQIDSLQRGYSVAIAREGWPPLVLHAKRHPGETAEQAMSREGVLRFLNEALSASYGVPA